MAITHHIMQSSGRLSVFKEEIDKATTEILAKIEDTISLPDVDIVVCDSPNRTIPEIGVGGETQTPNLVFVYIDPEFPNLRQSFGKEIRSTIAHELVHSARENVLGPDRTLLEAVVSEGLADHFDIEITGASPHPWDTALNKQQLTSLKDKAQSEFWSKDYNHTDWFFGSEDKNIPRWTGYSLGFYIISNFLQRESKKASEVYSLEASSFI